MNIKANSNDAPNYREGSARAARFAAVKKYNNKSVDAFIKATTDKPPALTKSGKAEPPAGRLRYFVNEGAVELVE